MTGEFSSVNEPEVDCELEDSGNVPVRPTPVV